MYIALSTLGIIFIAVGLLVLLFFIAGLLGARARDRRQAGSYAEHVANADAALEQARARAPSRPAMKNRSTSRPRAMKMIPRVERAMYTAKPV